MANIGISRNINGVPFQRVGVLCAVESPSAQMLALKDSTEREKNTPIFTINSGSFSPGIYNVSVSIKNGVSQTNKLVIIH